MGWNAPNPVAAYAGGVEAKGIVDDRQNQNALRQYVQQNGAGIMSGDQNALAGLGGMGPQGLEMAMGVQNTQLNQQATRQGMAIDREGLGMARQQIAAATPSDPGGKPAPSRLPCSRRSAPLTAFSRQTGTPADSS